MSIAILDYGVGNLRSVQKALEHVGGKDVVITSEPAVARSAYRVILPGVGAFEAAASRLRQSGLDDVVRETVASGKPLLGICVGMQLLLTRGFEMGEWDGLDIVPGDVVKFDTPGLKIPQIGWNSVVPRGESPLLRGIPPDMMFYFVHSYYCRVTEPSCVAGETEYGITYCSVISNDNVHAAQFHPEKSGRAGLAFLRNFTELSS